MQAITEVLTAQPAIIEWRLLSNALRQMAVRQRQIIAIGPPRQPYLPGLQQNGLDHRHIIWVDARTSTDRLWTTEQLIKANACGAIVAWLPQASPEQIRRLQVCAQSCEGLVFICRPALVAHESSAAPLRVMASFELDWQLQVQILKRRGPVHDRPLLLPSVPGGLSAVLTPRLLQPSRLFPVEVSANVMGRPAATAQRQHNVVLQ